MLDAQGSEDLGLCRWRAGGCAGFGGRDTATFVAGSGITGMVLKLDADVPGIGEDDFQAAANDAKENCPVSQALKNNVPITLEATLRSS